MEHNKYMDAVACDYLLVNNKEETIDRKNCMKDPIGCGIIFQSSQLFEIGLYDEEFQSGIGRSLPFDTQSYQQLFRFITSPQKEDMPLHRSLTSSYTLSFDEWKGRIKTSLFHEKLIETTERKLFDISYLLFEPIREYQSKTLMGEETSVKLEGMLPLHMAEIRSTEPTWKPGEYGE